jgi:hypothetical protein
MKGRTPAVYDGARGTGGWKLHDPDLPSFPEPPFLFIVFVLVGKHSYTLCFRPAFCVLFAEPSRLLIQLETGAHLRDGVIGPRILHGTEDDHTTCHEQGDDQLRWPNAHYDTDHDFLLY